MALLNESGSTRTISTTASAIGIEKTSTYKLTDL
ncbi:MAG TPA: hypothetical protein VH333_12195 [Pseudonocardiaceae bacterium]|nr:hypothetical protein [Pseudonocardiaceae bacterium]